jgi:porphobilinogen synthase
VALDIAEGAGIVMVKTALPYLDIIFRAKERFGMPTFACQAKGEYAIIMAAAERAAFSTAAMPCRRVCSVSNAPAPTRQGYFSVG